MNVSKNRLHNNPLSSENCIISHISDKRSVNITTDDVNNSTSSSSSSPYLSKRPQYMSLPIVKYGIIDINANNDNNCIRTERLHKAMRRRYMTVVLTFVLLVSLSIFYLFSDPETSPYLLYKWNQDFYFIMRQTQYGSINDNLVRQSGGVMVKRPSPCLSSLNITHKITVLRHLRPLVRLHPINIFKGGLSVSEWYPDHIDKALLEWKRKTNLSTYNQTVYNSATVSTDEADYTRMTSLIRPLSMNIDEICTIPIGKVSERENLDNDIEHTIYGSNTTIGALITLYALKDYVQEAALTGHPIVIDFGCVVGYIFATTHKTSTVICVHENGRRERREKEEVGLPNLLHIYSEGSFLDDKFVQFYEICNFFTIVFALHEANIDHYDYNINMHTKNNELLSLLKAVLPISAVVYAAIPTTFLNYTSTPTIPHDYDASAFLAASSNNTVDGRGPIIENISSSVVVQIQSLMPSGNRHTFSIIQYRVYSSQRPCKKTWNAPLNQWNKTTVISFINGLVTFEIETIGNESKYNTMRVIDPLQYIPSINMDTLLGAGLPEYVRIMFLGVMIATPRYSDPLPHNWVIAGGGKVLRIDKFDDVFDSKVNESEAYWGRSTLGYLHLLAVHLCIPVDVVSRRTISNISRLLPGLPSVVSEYTASCRNYCMECVGMINDDSSSSDEVNTFDKSKSVNSTFCSYLPKGRAPCHSCVMCGSGQLEGMEASSNIRTTEAEVNTYRYVPTGKGCMEEIKRNMIKQQKLLGNKVELKPKSCQVSYPAMFTARKTWRRWEKGDRNGWRVLLSQKTKKNKKKFK